MTKITVLGTSILPAKISVWLLRNAVFCCCVKQNLYMFNLYRNPYLDERIFYRLQTSRAPMKAEDGRTSFLFVGDLDCHLQERLDSTIRNRPLVAAFDFASVFGCDQLVVGPTHARGGTLNLLMADVLDPLQIAVVTPIGNSDDSPLPAVILMPQSVPNLCVSI